MGRRKERRMAAISAAGRRVKLDLSVEPTGDMAHSSLHTEVGGNLDQEEQAGNLSSPSSSGLQQEVITFLGEKQGNPLLLLGQYSDEEVDGNADEVEKTDLEEASVDTDDKEEKNVDQYDNTTKSDKHAVSNNEKLEFSEGDEKNIVDRREIQKTNLVNGIDSHDEVHPTIGTCDLDASGPQIVGDASGGWQLVMHEESNQYYYWNTLTGETSWEIPDILAQAAGSSTQHTSPLPPDQSLPYVVNGAVDMGNNGIISRSTPVYAIGTTAGLESSDAVNMIYNSSQTLQNYGNNGINVSISQDEDRDKQLTSESHEGADVHSAPLIVQCESLLEKLKAIDRSDLVSKFIFEVDTRLSDCKALSSFGSSILPFWLHTKTQLNQLESVLEKEISGSTKSDHHNVVDYTDSSPIQGGSEMAQLGNGTLSSSEHFHSCDVDNEKGNQKEEIHLPAKSLIENGNLHSGSPCHVANSGPKSVNLEESTPSHFIAKIESGAGEDVDMDVEMEVDEETPVIDQATRGSSSTEHPVLQEESVQPVPPPPDEEWVPPPPPDAEPDPPLPPEEPPSVPPPSYAEAVHSFPYVEQYSMGYSIPRFQYYAPSADGAQGIGYYADEAHVADRQPVQCYESTSYANVGAVVSAEPVVYYDPQSASIPTAPAVSSSDLSLYVESRSISHAGDVYSDHPGSAGNFTKAGNFELPLQNVESDFSLAVSKTDKINVPANGASSISQTNESVHMKGNDADVTSTITTKNPSKVARGKKRVVMVAPTLRSNKKVSSLVDKWKAAKEELHEDEEDESEDAYEALEKKRQKEIEEWRARQIASGEAQENANFLPLGGDWRDRVKRRRAESSAVSRNSPSEESTKKKPDLVELLKGLPSGWQAYWDESSKKVYYGNLNTSETTWTRPSS